jgi:signal transduction histidine kinase/ligand-binding sensor domain-containing protein
MGRIWLNKIGVLMLALTCLCLPASALTSRISFDDYNHAVWTTSEGAPAEINSLAQTPDGWLWLGTSTGLYRFDGLHFEYVSAVSQGDVPKRRIGGLRAESNGDLWISYDVGGLSVRHQDGKVEDLLPLESPVGVVASVARDASGTLWVAGSNGLFRSVAGHVLKIGPAQNLPAPELINSMLQDQYGRLWVLTPSAVYRLDRGKDKFVLIKAFSNQYGGLTQAPDGSVWVGAKDLLVQLPSAPPPGIPALRRASTFNWLESRQVGQFDRDGNFWAVGCAKVVCVVDAAEVDSPLRISRRDRMRFDPTIRLSSRFANVVIEDREGDIWVGTQTSLDRWRENRLIPLRLPQSGGLFTMAGDMDGIPWLIDERKATAWRLAPGKPPQADRSAPFTAIANDRHGALLLASKRWIERRYRDRKETIRLPPDRNGRASDLDVVGMQDDGEVLWMASPQTGMMGYMDGHWLPRTAFTLPPRIFLGAVGAKPGQRWFGTGDGTLVFSEKNTLISYDAHEVGLVTSIDVRDDVVMGGDDGLAVLRDGRLRKLLASPADVLKNVSGIGVTAEGDRWLNGSRGVVHVRRDDWRASMADPAIPLQYELLGVLDGYQGQAQLMNRLPSVYRSPSGQLWFMTSVGVVRLDPDEIRRNTIPPTPQVLDLRVDDKVYAAQAGLRLLPGTKNFRISFSAPGLARPEATRVVYRLTGTDEYWQEANTRRVAYYTNMKPGTYTFRVRAWNEDGVQSQTDAVLVFEIAPAFSQTIWFELLCWTAIALALYSIYRYRLRRKTMRIADEMHTRLVERERIARTLHDTFLQSLQAVILRVDAVTHTLPNEMEAHRRLAAIVEQAHRTLAEGRDQVHELRLGTGMDIELIIGEAGKQCTDEMPSMTFGMSVRGLRMALRSLVVEETCEIVREAIRNAFRHADGKHVDVLLVYGFARFCVTVRDDGKGMLKGFIVGKHFGLVGMKERAGRIGGKLLIESEQGKGTCVSLRVPARLAYRRRWSLIGRVKQLW